MPADVSDLCCVHPPCPDAGRRGMGNILFLWWSGKARNIRFVRCRSCGSRFSERKGTPMFGARLGVDEVEAIAKHLIEGDGQRKTGRLTGHRQDTVAAWTRKLGLHARAVHDELARHLKVPEAQFDEKWSFVGKKRGPPHPRGTSDRPVGG